MPGKRVGLSGLQRIRNADQQHAWLLSLALHGHSHPLRLTRSKQVDGNSICFRPPQKHGLLTFFIEPHVLYFHPQSRAALLIVIKREHDTDGSRQRLTRIVLQYSAETD